MRKILFNENYQKELMKKGYIKVPVLSQSEISYFLKKIETLHPNDSFNPLPEKQYGFTYHLTFLDDNKDYRKKVDDLIREVFTPFVNQFMVNYKTLLCNLIIKPSGKGIIQPHQDWHCSENIADTNLSVWCPLVDTDSTNGTLQIVEGSHKITSDISCPHATWYFDNFVDSIITKYSTPIYTKAGEAVIFDSTLIHWSADNMSGNSRPVAQFMAIPSESKYVTYYADADSPNEGFEMVEIGGDFIVNNSLTQSLTRPEEVKTLRVVENKNRKISEEEFLGLMKRGDEIRNAVYFAKKSITTKNRFSALNRIKGIFQTLFD